MLLFSDTVEGMLEYMLEYMLTRFEKNNVTLAPKNFSLAPTCYSPGSVSPKMVSQLTLRGWKLWQTSLGQSPKPGCCSC